MKTSKKLFYNKTGKGLASLAAIVILLSAVLASSIFYESSITANVVRENQFDKSLSLFPIEESKEGG